MKFLLAVFLISSAYEVIIPRNERLCFGEDISADTLLVGEVHMRDMKSHSTISVSLIDKDGNILHQKGPVKEDKFSLISTNAGPHSLCIQNNQAMSCVVNFSITSGVAAKDYSNLSLAKDLKESERRVEKMVESIKEIQKELQTIKERDTEMTYTNETIQSRVIVYSVITIVLLLTLAILQMMYLKRFLKSKKMI